MKSKIFSIAKSEIQRNFRSILIYSVLIGALLMLLMTMFDPELFGDLSAILENYPESLRQMIGDNLDLTRIEGFVNIYVFTFSWMWYGIYLMIRIGQDIPEEIEKKTIDIVLSKPISRTEYILGKKMQQILMILIIMIISFGLVIAGIAMPGGSQVSDLNMKHLIIGFVWMTLLLMSLEATAFFFSSFLTPKKALSFSIGMLVLFYFIGTFWQSMNENLQNIKYLSLFHYFDTAGLMLDGILTNIFRDCMILFGYSVVLTGGALIIFHKRDIPV